MNICHGLLNAMQVSSWELEEMIQIARRHGALGAKLTGGGGGGSIIALCPRNPARPIALNRVSVKPAIRQFRLQWEASRKMVENMREKVSFDDEPLILVDEDDNEVGYRSKGECHEGHGILHRAFSIFLFDKRGRVLLQQRAAGKRLWPLHWSNSCCSHPRRGETMDQALHRRLREELGLEASLKSFTSSSTKPISVISVPSTNCATYTSAHRAAKPGCTRPKLPTGAGCPWKK